MRERAPLTAKEIAQIKQCYRRGDTIPEIMKRFDITRKTVYYHLKKYRRGHTRRYDRKEVLDAIATRNMLGYSDRATARRLGISHDTVGRYRASMGLPPVPKGSQRKKEQW